MISFANSISVSDSDLPHALSICGSSATDTGAEGIAKALIDNLSCRRLSK
jgi:hypothetical protein